MGTIHLAPKASKVLAQRSACPASWPMCTRDGWRQLPLGSAEAVGGAGRVAECLTTSMRSLLSSLWGMMCQQWPLVCVPGLRVVSIPLEGLSPTLLLPSPAANSALSLWFCSSRVPARNARQNTMSAGVTAPGDPGCSLCYLGPLQGHRLSPERAHNCLDVVHGVIRNGCTGDSGF